MPSIVDLATWGHYILIREKETSNRHLKLDLELRLCSDPTDRAAEIYRASGYNPVFLKCHTVKPQPPPPA